MECDICGNEWEGSNLMAYCPFCGEKIALDKRKETYMGKIIADFGEEILQNDNLLYSVISDTLPSDSEFSLERIRLAINANIDHEVVPLFH